MSSLDQQAPQCCSSDCAFIPSLCFPHHRATPPAPQGTEGTDVQHAHRTGEYSNDIASPFPARGYGPRWFTEGVPDGSTAPERSQAPSICPSIHDFFVLAPTRAQAPPTSLSIRNFPIFASVRTRGTTRRQQDAGYSGRIRSYQAVANALTRALSRLLWRAALFL